MQLPQQPQRGRDAVHSKAREMSAGLNVAFLGAVSASRPASRHGHPTCGTCSASRHEEISKPASGCGAPCLPSLWDMGAGGADTLPGVHHFLRVREHLAHSQINRSDGIE